MRNISVVVTVVVILLDASCMLTSCRPTDSSIWSLDEFAIPKQFSDAKFKPAIEKLNAYLEGKTESIDLDANKEAAKSYLGEAKKDPAVEKLVELLQKIDSKEECTAERISSLWNLQKALDYGDPESFGKPTRLREVALNCIDRARPVCFAEFEKQWLDKGASIVDRYGKSIVATFIDKDHVKGPSQEPAADNRDVKMLQAALQTYFIRNPSTKIEELTEKEWNTAMGQEFKKWLEPNLKKLKSLIIGKKDQGEEVTEENVDDEYYKPCEGFVNREESKSILRPVGQLADLVDLKELDVGPDDRVSSFLWASRYYGCKFFLLKDKSEFVRAIKRVLSKLK